MVLSPHPLRSTSPPPSGAPSKPSPPNERNAPTVLLRTVEEYVAAAARAQTHQSGKYRDIVHALTTPAADLYLSTRPATALHAMNIRHAYGLVALEPRDLQERPNVGRTSSKEVKATLAALGLTSGMTLEEDAFRAAVAATVAAHIRGTTI